MEGYSPPVEKTQAESLAEQTFCRDSRSLANSMSFGF